MHPKFMESRCNLSSPPIPQILPLLPLLFTLQRPRQSHNHGIPRFGHSPRWIVRLDLVDPKRERPAINQVRAGKEDEEEEEEEAGEVEL